MKEDKEGRVRTRFAPSPTGYLHIGGARTALFNYLFSRHCGGKFILRIEDTDQERSREESTSGIFEGLRWLGLEWDEGPYFQSERKEIYHQHLEILKEKGMLYQCYCTAEELEERRSKALSEGKKPKYDGRCKDMKTPPPAGRPYVLRFKTPDTGFTTIHDLIKKEVVFDNSELDDLILMRSDGYPTYNFAVVVDDITMGITHIIRGDDHLNNTPRQLLLYEAFGFTPPKFAHVPLILGQDKARLSKRHGATSVLAYRDMGYLPQAMVNFLARIGWSFGDQEIFSLDELIEKFSLENVGKSAGVFNEEKLIWLNSHYIKNESDEALADLLTPFLEKRGFFSTNRDGLVKITACLKERSKTLQEMAEVSEYFFRPPREFVPDAAKKFLTHEIERILSDMINQINAMTSFQKNEIEILFKKIQDVNNIKLVKLAQAVRVALTGKAVSPGIYEVMEILGREEIVSRLQKAINYIESS